MTYIFLTKNISCGNTAKECDDCSTKINNKLKKAYPNLKQGKNYHVSIVHENNNHLIFFCIYEKDGYSITCNSKSELVKPDKKYIAKFEINNKNKILQKGIYKINSSSIENIKAEKYNGDIPTLTQVQKVCD